MTLFHHPLRHFTRWGVVAMVAAALVLLTACEASGQMDTQPRYNPLSASSFFPNGSSALPLVPGTIPYYGTLPANSPVITGMDANGQPYQGFPLPVTQDLVVQGQQRYTIYCVVCHGTTGKGDGKVISFQFPKPPDLLSDDVSAMPNGHIFLTIENGFGKMFPYGPRVNYTERWAIISYIRAMELQNGAVDPTTLTAAQLDQIGNHP